jgi:hypothetical protein
LEEGKTDNDYQSQAPRYINKLGNAESANKELQMSFRNDLIKVPNDDLNQKLEEGKLNQSIDNSNLNNITSSMLPVTARD